MLKNRSLRIKLISSLLGLLLMIAAILLLTTYISVRYVETKRVAVAERHLQKIYQSGQTLSPEMLALLKDTAQLQIVPGKEIEQSRSTLIWSMGGTSLSLLLGIILALILGWRFAGKITRRLQKIGYAATALARGESPKIIPVTEKDEIGKLTEGFNRMSMEILDYRDALLAHARELEQKVAEKTRELEQKKASLEKRVKERTRGFFAEKEKFQSLAENALAGIYIIQDNRFKYANARLCEIMGYSPEELSKISVEETAHPDDRGLVAKNIRARLEKRVPSVHYTFRALRKNGDAIVLEVLGAAMDYEGRPAIQGMALDVTKKEQYREEMEKKIAELEEFHNLAVGRELRLMELEKEIERLKQEKK